MTQYMNFEDIPRKQVAVEWDGAWFCDECETMVHWKSKAYIINKQRLCSKCAQRKFEGGAPRKKLTGLVICDVQSCSNYENLKLIDDCLGKCLVQKSSSIWNMSNREGIECSKYIPKETIINE